MVKTFVLGLGAQKAGTSWFYDWLMRKPGAVAGERKEYNVWNRVSGLEDMPPPKPGAIKLMCQDPDFYFDYFADLLDQPDCMLTSDFSPGYAGLDADTLRQISHGFQRRGIRCVAVFLMRDPVERLWSMARMNHARQKTPKVDFSDSPSSEDVLLRIYQTPRAAMRTRYDNTLQAMEAAFPASDRFVGIYEELFVPGGTENVSELLGIPANSSFKVRVNQGPAAPRPSSPVLARVAEEYRCVYAACRSRYPRLKSIWPGYSLLA